MTYAKMNIVDKSQAELGWLKNQSVKVTETVLEILKPTLASGEDVMVSVFGNLREEINGK